MPLVQPIDANDLHPRYIDAVTSPFEYRYDLYVPDKMGNPKFWIKHEPRVYLVGGTEIREGDPRLPGFDQFYEDEGLEKPSYESLMDNGARGTLIELAGRLCYYSFKKPRPGGHKAYMERILGEGHGSVLEHAHFNFVITGVSRSFSHELVRARLASYSQLSQRFFEEVECSFICPPKILRHPGLFSEWIKVMEACYDGYVNAVATLNGDEAYSDLLVDGDKTDVRKSILGEARSQLPNATETKLMFSLNARALRGVIEQRAYKKADQEIRRVAVKLYEFAYDELRSGFSDYDRHEDTFGRYVTTNYKKV